jgi:prepilin-type N-terminal cleavage/methylation domain-containing protein
MARSTRTLAGFSFVELLVVITVLALLAAVAVPRVRDHRRAARDGRRLTDARIPCSAIEQYRADRGHYPAARPNADFGGWDVSHDGGFLEALLEAGYLQAPPHDPIDDATFHYRYYLYDPGAFGCAGSEPYFVLGVRNFETNRYAAKHRGYFACPERDFGSEFAYVTGGGPGLER